MTINYKKNTIEMTKKDAREASKFGTETYKQLQEIRKDNPNFKLVIKETTKKSDSFRGLTYDFMKKYIETHDDDKKSVMKEFEVLRRNDSETLAETVSYGEIKKWFLKKYPAISEFHKKRESILAA